jgi:electron transport complex protein RnfG
MQTANHSDAAARPASWPMYRALVGVGVACGLLIVSVFVLTLPVIARNEAVALQKAVLQVLPGAVSKQSFVFVADGSFRPAGGGDAGQEMVHAGYDADGRLLGVAVEGRGMGYQDVIRILYGYSPQQQAIVGMQVLASKETPGLGDKIEKDPSFLANFRALDVRLAADGASLENTIEAVKNGTKTSPWQIDGITGATISSKAIASILLRGSAQWVPTLHARQADLISEGGPDGE